MESDSNNQSPLDQTISPNFNRFGEKNQKFFEQRPCNIPVVKVMIIQRLNESPVIIKAVIAELDKHSYNLTIILALPN